MNPPPPIPQDCRFTIPVQNDAATAASTALPLKRRIFGNKNKSLQI